MTLYVIKKHTFIAVDVRIFHHHCPPIYCGILFGFPLRLTHVVALAIRVRDDSIWYTEDVAGEEVFLLHKIGIRGS